jgi:hypothetical protein
VLRIHFLIRQTLCRASHRPSVCKHSQQNCYGTIESARIDPPIPATPTAKRPNPTGQRPRRLERPFHSAPITPLSAATYLTFPLRPKPDLQLTLPDIGNPSVLRKTSTTASGLPTPRRSVFTTTLNGGLEVGATLDRNPLRTAEADANVMPMPAQRKQSYRYSADDTPPEPLTPN